MFFVHKYAVSKSRHHLLFYPTKERVKRTKKYLFRDFLSKGGRLWKGKVLAPFPSVVFHGLLSTCSFLKISSVFMYFEKFACFMIILVSVLKSVIKRF